MFYISKGDEVVISRRFPQSIIKDESKLIGAGVYIRQLVFLENIGLQYVPMNLMILRKHWEMKDTILG